MSQRDLGQISAPLRSLGFDVLGGGPRISLHKSSDIEVRPSKVPNIVLQIFHTIQLSLFLQVRLHSPLLSLVRVLVDI